VTGRALVTGATGFVGGRLSSALAEDGWDVRCLVRDRSRTAPARAGFEVHEGDVLRPETLRSAGRGIGVAYYLVHSMGRGPDGDFSARERAAAEAFSRMARDEGVERVVYLGGSATRRSRSTCAAASPKQLSRVGFFLCLPKRCARGWVSSRTEPMSLGAWPLIRVVSPTFARSATTPPTGVQSLIDRGAL
jgi:NAD(P)H-binding